MALKVLPIISTLVRAQHNPGDTFIGLGVQYLVERVLGPANWFIIDKFGSSKPWEKNKDLIKEAGIVIYAGTPQYNNFSDWCFYWDKEMWSEYIYPLGLKVISLAGGAGFPDAEFTPRQFSDYCLTSELTKELLLARKESLVLTTVRDIYAHTLLNDLGIPNTFLPCAATFASRYVGVPLERVQDLMVITAPSLGLLPDQYTVDGDKGKTILNQWLPIVEYYRNFYNVKVVCHNLGEFLLFRDFLPEQELFFSTTYMACLKVYMRAHTVISARLHGSLPAYGMCNVKVVNVTIDTRGHAVEVFPGIASFSYKDLSLARVVEAVASAVPAEPSVFEPYINQYEDLLGTVLRG